MENMSNYNFNSMNNLKVEQDKVRVKKINEMLSRYVYTNAQKNMLEIEKKCFVNLLYVEKYFGGDEYNRLREIVVGLIDKLYYNRNTFVFENQGYTKSLFDVAFLENKAQNRVKLGLLPNKVSTKETENIFASKFGASYKIITPNEQELLEEQENSAQEEQLY